MTKRTLDNLENFFISLIVFFTLMMVSGFVTNFFINGDLALRFGFTGAIGMFASYGIAALIAHFNDKKL